MNIIIRTSNRPNYFKNCVNSIRKHCPNATLHITIDNNDDRKYVVENTLDFDIKIYEINRIDVLKKCSGIKLKRDLLLHNYYFNIVKPHLNGWCLFLDDDDELLLNPSVDEGINIKTIFLYRADVGWVVPEDNYFRKKPTICHISGLCIVFHSTQMVEWKPIRCGDYEFISEMYNKTKHVVWVDKIISKVQTSQNGGNKNDIVL